MNPDPKASVYLGDGVYVHWNGFQLILTTGHDEIAHADNVVYMEAEVVESFTRYLEQLTAILKHEL